jgi:uracil-DNA glycosylase family 4
VSSEAFLSLYLKEIGVQTPVSSFLSVAQQHESTIKPTQNDIQKKPSIISQSMAPVVSYDSPIAPQEITVPLEVLEPTPTLPPISIPQEAPSPEKYVQAKDLLTLEKQAEACTSCELVHSRNKLVFGGGPQQADLVFISEAPGRDEDMAGKPFVGSSGALFNRMLASIGLTRDDVYVMHGVKCRPQHNRDPKPEEFAACESWLTAQLEMLQPKMICMLGRVVAQSLLKTDASLTELRVNRHTFRGIPVQVIDHPSYLLRSQQHKRRAWEDLCRLQNFLQTL